MDVNGVVRRDDDTLHRAIFLNTGVESAEGMTGVIETSSGFGRGVDTTVEMEVDQLAWIPKDGLWRESQLTIESNLDVDICQCETNESE